FLPNRWIDVDRLNSSLFRCEHLPEEKLVGIGQEKILRLYVRRPPLYQFVYETRIPNNGFITDFACGTKGDQLAYATSNAYGIEAYFAISYTMDDQYFVIGRAGGHISIVGVDEPTHYSFEAHENDIKAICCSKANPSLFYSGCADGFCKMWDYRAPNNCIPLSTSCRNDYSITHIDSDSYDRYIVTTSGGVKFDIWDVRRFSENISFNMQRNQRINLLDEIPLFNKVFDIITGGIVREFRKDCREVYDCSWHPNQNEIVTVSVSSLIECKNKEWLGLAFRNKLSDHFHK
ncbi:unnamed protein product, partial [Litomosoides sigmodontis]